MPSHIISTASTTVKLGCLSFLVISTFGWQCSFSSSRRPSLVQVQARRTPSQEYDYYDSYYNQDLKSKNLNDKYWDDYEEDDESSKKAQNRGGMYKVYFDGGVDPTETQLDWESCSDGESEALVLLPPAAVERPSAVLHFVGGTFFGSAPRVWYANFLEDLVRNTQCAIVVTPIPVTLFKSPLQHVDLSQKLQRAFEYAWNEVLEDEYGDLSDIPLCGVGHSLGSRLLVVSTTLDLNKPRNRIPPYKSFALISFTNFGASAGIPGVTTLLRQSRLQEQKAQVKSERKRKKEVRQARRDLWIDDDYDEDYLDEDWEELVGELQDVLQEQATRVKAALTPKSEDLEFFPSPDMLWKALEVDKRYRIPETLLVQFDDDQIDQSAKLAKILKGTNSTDIKFARLRGSHLSPITVNKGEPGSWFELPSKASKTVWKAIRGRSKTKSQETAMRDLRQTIARYITDVVRK